MLAPLVYFRKCFVILFAVLVVLAQWCNKLRDKLFIIERLSVCRGRIYFLGVPEICWVRCKSKSAKVFFVGGTIVRGVGGVALAGVFEKAWS